MHLPLFDDVPAGGNSEAGPPEPTKTVRSFLYPNHKTGGQSTVTVVDHGRPQVTIRCTCQAFKFTRWHECWHVKDVARKHRLFTVIGGCLVNYPPDLASGKGSGL